MKTINYTGNSKLISRIVHLLNRKAPLPLDGDGDAVWGTNGQVLTTDGQGNTSWTTPQGGGGDVTDVEVNGTSVVNAQGVAEVSVPTKTSDLNNDSGFIDGTDLSTALSDYTPTANLATVATSGDYSDLQNKPTIPDELADLADDSTHRTVTDTQISTWNGKSDFSGSYNDLTDKPTIPTVNDGTLTIQKNGTTVQTFTANQSGNATANLQVVDAHVIENPTGTDMTQRANMQFADAHLTDDSGNDRTKVENVKAVDSTGWSNATEDGLYDVDDGGNYVPITGAEIEYANGQSINDAINELKSDLTQSVLTTTKTVSPTDTNIHFVYIDAPSASTPKSVIAQCIAPSSNADCYLQLWIQHEFITGAQTIIRYKASAANYTYTIKLTYLY